MLTIALIKFSLPLPGSVDKTKLHYTIFSTLAEDLNMFHMRDLKASQIEYVYKFSVLQTHCRLYHLVCKLIKKGYSAKRGHAAILISCKDNGNAVLRHTYLWFSVNSANKFGYPKDCTVVTQQIIDIEIIFEVAQYNWLCDINELKSTKL